ncbi:mesenchyme-specific cell surface glycoprotein-like [Haliotis cracherodii]|uniref:mesenchyme-specific cell surface glycoprotein-like n=1 Tax=Haliotis rufescens TaxID=6454 RepID=UPI001EAFFC8D|nr:mesenchyme-specific cell surface glycoprotein-like [Haliotis rufescens]
MLTFYLGIVALHLVAAVPITRPLAYIKVPDGSGNTRPFLGTADRIAYDSDQNYLYVIGGRSETLHIVDMQDPSNPTIAYSQTFSEITDGIPKAISLCRSGQTEQVAIAFAARSRLNEGHVEVFRTFLRFDQTFPLLGRVSTESDPVAIQYDGTCARFVVACEGLPGTRNNNFEDPLAHVDIFERNVDAWTKYTINFQSARGLGNARYVFRDPNNAQHSVVNDLEPSDVTIDDNNIVYVTLMENNALAVFNLNNLVGGVDIYSLGSKDWNNFDIDTSDQDQSISPDRINMVRRNIRSFYQPGAIISLNFGGNVFLATANTGAVKRYTTAVEGVDFTEANRASTFDSTLLDPNMDSGLVDDLSSNAALGRLYVSNLQYDTDGWNPIFGYFENIFAYGGRSWSLWDASSATQQWDSGSDLEYEVREYNGSVFNGDCTSINQSPPQSLDTRSDDKGPEPKAIATTLFGSDQIVAVGSGRMGAIYLYRLGESEAPGFPQGEFQSYNRLGDYNGNWGQLYDSNEAGTPFINDLKFVNQAGQTLLLAVGSQMGVIAVHELYEGTFP